MAERDIFVLVITANVTPWLLPGFIGAIEHQSKKESNAPSNKCYIYISQQQLKRFRAINRDGQCDP